jgi:hypothetical protein
VGAGDTFLVARCWLAATTIQPSAPRSVLHGIIAEPNIRMLTVLNCKFRECTIPSVRKMYGSHQWWWWTGGGGLVVTCLGFEIHKATES